MHYSIVIPVFNREDLTQQCLETLRPTLVGAGDGEIIVVDNGSGPATAQVLAAHPWARTIRNDRNLGFAAACNQGARAATGRYIVHLNNDTVGTAGWLAAMLRAFEEEPNLGVVGARLLYPNGTIQHAGVALAPARFGVEGVVPYHVFLGRAGSDPLVCEPSDYQAVTGACLVTPRSLFAELGGFDEAYWNGYEDVDYCFRVRARGLRVRYEPRAVVYHFESQSGVQRKRRVALNIGELARRWNDTIEHDDNTYLSRGGEIRREYCANGVRSFRTIPLPAVTVFVHGASIDASERLLKQIRDSRIAPARILWNASGPQPDAAADLELCGGDPVAAARAAMELRGDRYLVFIDARADLHADWLTHLITQTEFGADVAGATYASEAAPSKDIVLDAADARLTLVSLRQIPQHLRLRDAATLDEALADLLLRNAEAGRAIRGVTKPIATLPPLRGDAPAALGGFASSYASRVDCVPLETDAAGDLASIVMLSYNAPQYTKMAVESIRAVTRRPYEIVLIDNGSGPDTIAYLRTIERNADVRVIYNATNTGFAHGCNQGLGAARGRYVVLLNNDVVVTEGWLDALIGAHERNPRVGVSAPRSNRVAGHQQLHDATYPDIDAMHRYAAERSRRHRRRTYLTDRAIGFCLCIERRVLDEVGGIDERYHIGNFEDDDFCVRVRAAGYEIAICEDAFIHHFGSVSFAANKIDYVASMQANWERFALRWGYPLTFPAERGYDPTTAIARGFDRARDHVPLRLPARDPAPPPDGREYRFAFAAVVSSEREWNDVGRTLNRYLQAFTSDDPVLFAVAATGVPDAAALGARVERSAQRLSLAMEATADVTIDDVSDVAAWRETLRAHIVVAAVADARLSGLATLEDRSPSGLKRLVAHTAV